MVVTTVYHLKIYWEYHNLISTWKINRISDKYITSSEYFVQCATCVVLCLLDDSYSSDCEVINDTARLTCSFPFRLSSTANVVWTFDDTNVITKKYH